ncbi:MAG TPA: nucleoid occlusion factor SlmA [Rhodocyclaceae bacterium]|nr:nucleoid occlusion factor SlmA [Rhodocyclaceae bacterium]HMV52328.1 nucleoid occlusion factor SlmA [Rhodocyclaceae bacterium]HNA02968.1 nucleoid occlusion factor SlmA [Rhodocyclaceae bacterium]HNB78088.1 nucleoid occlusion factor SlmA [Rhodocyclaceae bacterium]HNC60539.1 nucleoid occlusion factor SlmA [Rhodocyclaceae bacterium]
MGTKPGERKLQILQTLAEMLQNPKGEKITTAALAARLDVSEAALYRHFASKAQMFEGLIEFIESSLFSVINTIQAEQQSGIKQVELVMGLLLGFAQKNRGLTRVLVGDALVNEDERLQTRINQLIDRCEAALKQALRIAVTNNELLASEDVGAAANMLMCYVIGRWNLFAKSGFTREPMAQWASQWPMLCAACLSQPVVSNV